MFRRILLILAVFMLAPSVAQAAPYRNLLSIDFAVLPSPPSAVTSAANAAPSPGASGGINLSDQDDKGDTNAFAAGLVFAKTGDAAARSRVCTAMANARGTEAGARALALGRNVQGLAYAWDLIGGPNSGCANAATLNTWLIGLRDASTTGGPTSVKDCHLDRPNNWGTHCGAARIALDRIAGDTTDLNNAAAVFHGYVGDRASYAGFSYGELSWQCNSSAPVGIDPPGCTKSGVNMDGVVPDDARRCGTFSSPPCFSNYVREAHQGSTLQALQLAGAGFDAINWNTQAVKRVMDFVYRTTFSDGRHVYDGDDAWLPCVINKLYGTSYSGCDNSVGKGAGFAAYWAPGITLGGAPPPPPPAQCADGVDNDLDTLIDFPADPGCSSATDNDETNAPPGDSPPSIPSGLTVTGVTQTSLTLNWNASTDDHGVTGYETFQDGTSKGTVTTLSKTYSGLTCGTSYTLGVEAVDTIGQHSGRANVVGAQTSACSGGGGTGTFTATSDTWVDSGAVTDTHGSELTARTDGSPLRRAYFRFPTTGNSGVAAVKVHLCQSGTSSGSSIEFRTLTSPEPNWSEATLSWATQPTVSGVVATLSAVAGCHDYPVPTTVLQPNGATTIVVGRPTSVTTTADFATRESASKPQLIVT